MTAPDDSLRLAAKRELRKRMRALRAAIPASAIQARSAALTDRVLALAQWKRATVVALFHSLPDEVQTDALVAAARATNKRVAFPVVTESRRLTFRAPYDGLEPAEFVVSTFGVSEPSARHAEVPPAEIDLVVVPALAADETGHRIGYGGGYYDHTLPEMTRAVRLAVLFDFQLIAEVPARDGDERVDIVVTDARAVECERTPAAGG